MTVPHPQEHEQALERLLDVEADPMAALADSELRDCPECQRSLEDHVAMRTLLDEVGEELARARDDGAVSHAQVEADARFLQDHLGPPRAGRTPVRWLVPLMSAATLALVAWIALSFRPEPPRNLLGPGAAYEVVAPIGRSGDWTRFAWRGELPPQGYFRVQVFVLRQGTWAALTSASYEGPANEWRPDAAVAASWPDRIRWQVEAFDASGQRLGASVPVECTRSSP